MEEKETWANENSALHCGYIQDELPPVFEKVMGRNDVMIYVDPPWNLGNVNSFHTKNEDGRKLFDFKDFYRHLFEKISLLKVGTAYIEVGGKHLEDFETELREIYPFVDTFAITYYRKNPCFLLRGSHFDPPIDFDYFNGKDDDETPYLAIDLENKLAGKGIGVRPTCVIDLCIGRGGTAVAAVKKGINFMGLEMNKRRLACTIEKVRDLGVVLYPTQEK